MKIDSVTELAIPGVKLIRFGKFDDQRGYFTEPYRQSQMREVLPGFVCRQMNQSTSHPGVLRGMHIQTEPEMGKLVRVLSGYMYDLCLDLRPWSETFGKAIGVQMEADPLSWIWVPPGIGHGNYFQVETTIEYLCTAEYSAAGESGVCPLAADIDWIGAAFAWSDAILSDKDLAAPTVAQWIERGLI